MSSVVPLSPSPIPPTAQEPELKTNSPKLATMVAKLDLNQPVVSNNVIYPSLLSRIISVIQSMNAIIASKITNQSQTKTTPQAQDTSVLDDVNQLTENLKKRLSDLECHIEETAYKVNVLSQRFTAMHIKNIPSLILLAIRNAPSAIASTVIGCFQTPLTPAAARLKDIAKMTEITVKYEHGIPQGYIRLQDANGITREFDPKEGDPWNIPQDHTSKFRYSVTLAPIFVEDMRELWDIHQRLSIGKPTENWLVFAKNFTANVLNH